VVDISKKARHNGSSLASLRALKAAIQGNAFKEGVKVGMITFDERINFYRVNTSASGTLRATFNLHIYVYHICGFCTGNLVTENRTEWTI
jgi:hypothetical protein